jgi:hypothetical protein
MAQRLPRLPKSVWGPAGPIPVVRKQNLRAPDDGRPCDGLWVEDARTIYIDARCTLTYAWPTLLHEQAHAWLADLRIQLPERTEELLCNHLANCRMAELYQRLETGKPW